MRRKRSRRRRRSRSAAFSTRSPARSSSCTAGRTGSSRPSRPSGSRAKRPRRPCSCSRTETTSATTSRTSTAPRWRTGCWGSWLPGDGGSEQHHVAIVAASVRVGRSAPPRVAARAVRAVDEDVIAQRQHEIAGELRRGGEPAEQSIVVAPAAVRDALVASGDGEAVVEIVAGLVPSVDLEGTVRAREPGGRPERVAEVGERIDQLRSPERDGLHRGADHFGAESITEVHRERSDVELLRRRHVSARSGQVRELRTDALLSGQPEIDAGRGPVTLVERPPGRRADRILQTAKPGDAGERHLPEARDPDSEVVPEGPFQGGGELVLLQAQVGRRIGEIGDLVEGVRELGADTLAEPRAYRHHHVRGGDAAGVLDGREAGDLVALEKARLQWIVVESGGEAYRSFPEFARGQSAPQRIEIVAGRAGVLVVESPP